MTNFVNKALISVSLFFVLSVSIVVTAFAQQMQQEGKGLKQKTEQPLPGAHVYCLNTGQVSITDTDNG